MVTPTMFSRGQLSCLQFHPLVLAKHPWQKKETINFAMYLKGMGTSDNGIEVLDPYVT
jgi:hypothetical protein